MPNKLHTVRHNGNVLIAVDTAGRLLELADILEQLWHNKDAGFMAYTLALVSNVCYNVVKFAKSQIFKYLKICHGLNDFASLPSRKVVLASTPDIESGYARELFMQWASHPNNSYIITSRSSHGTLPMDLLENYPPGSKLEVDLKRCMKLEGPDLEEISRTQGEKLNRYIVEKVIAGESSSDSDDDIEISVATRRS